MKCFGFAGNAVLGLCLSSSLLAAPTPERKTELLYLLAQDCGACHGMRLKGGLGPPLLPDALHQWNAEQLAQTILHGRPGTPMPPWSPFMTEQEALWLAQQLKEGISQ
ncbi:c-type cytochrome [Thiolapillus brandeum]|uniref:C-type cytochrome c55x n=1 Tax=Thiolapillus brandeum TaxID=1076588 RepID=A0A7U6GL40_9GAMM|nr:cytochrome c [Thiolapillus brandeum]BAO45582.1 c-type cytochrome c55x [Thiolapillus brandeum]